MLVQFLFKWCVILSEDCDFWWFKLEAEIAAGKDEEDRAGAKTSAKKPRLHPLSVHTSSKGKK